MAGKMFGTESETYKKMREDLHHAELALRDQRERVAELRRELPIDTPVTDHRLQVIEAGQDDVEERSLSELFSGPDRSLVLLHFMFGKAQTNPCPMCSMWADGYDGVIRHLERRLDFAVCVAGDPREFRDYARSRGWSNLPIVGSGETSLKADLGFESPAGDQAPGASVFRLSESGEPLHFYSVCAMLDDGEFRGMDLLSPVWNFFDLTPEGRGDFMPDLG